MGDSISPRAAESIRSSLESARRIFRATAGSGGAAIRNERGVQEVARSQGISRDAAARQVASGGRALINQALANGNMSAMRRLDQRLNRLDDPGSGVAQELAAAASARVRRGTRRNRRGG